MAVDLTNNDISTRYALQEDFDNGFVGRDRQVVIQTDDPKGYRPVIMDGVTQGGKSKVALLTDLSDYVSVSTYNSDKAGFATKTELGSYATKTELGSYATKSELTSGLAGKADSSALASYATKEEVSAKADATSLNNYLPLSGGTVSGNLKVTGTLVGRSVRASSDARLKSEVTLYDVSLNTLHAYRYKLKNHDGYHIGLIAQEIQKIIPEAVDKDPSGYLSLDYNAIVALLVNKVNALEKRISILEEGK